MKRLYSLISSVIIIFLIISPVSAAIDADAGFESELTMPEVGYDLETGAGLFDQVPASASIAGTCLASLVTEKDLAFLGLDKINDILELLRLFNISLKLIVILPAFVINFWAGINFNMTKIFIIAAELMGLDTRNLIAGFLSDRLSCIGGASSGPR